MGQVMFPFTCCIANTDGQALVTLGWETRREVGSGPGRALWRTTQCLVQPGFLLCVPMPCTDTQDLPVCH